MLEFLKLFLIIFSIKTVVYFGFSYFIIIISPRSAPKIQEKHVSKKDYRREIMYSICSLIIFSLGITFIYQSFLRGETKIYTDYNQYGVFYLFASFFMLIYAHDIYFYITHRIMHMKGLFTVIHRVHHLSHNPTPLTAFSFHPFESIIQILYLPAVVYLIPAWWPILMLQFFYGFYLINIVGHSGYAYFSKIFTTGFFNYIAVTPQYHEIHHRLSKTNFGLYTPTWDKLMKTFQSIHTEKKLPSK